MVATKPVAYLSPCRCGGGCFLVVVVVHQSKCLISLHLPTLPYHHMHHYWSHMECSEHPDTHMSHILVHERPETHAHEATPDRSWRDHVCSWRRGPESFCCAFADGKQRQRQTGTGAPRRAVSRGCSVVRAGRIPDRLMASAGSRCTEPQ